jgi:hypothetical protein
MAEQIPLSRIAPRPPPAGFGLPGVFRGRRRVGHGARRGFGHGGEVTIGKLDVEPHSIRHSGGRPHGLSVGVAHQGKTACQHALIGERAQNPARAADHCGPALNNRHRCPTGPLQQHAQPFAIAEDPLTMNVSIGAQPHPQAGGEYAEAFPAPLRQRPGRPFMTLRELAHAIGVANQASAQHVGGEPHSGARILGQMDLRIGFEGPRQSFRYGIHSLARHAQKDIRCRPSPNGSTQLRAATL